MIVNIKNIVYKRKIFDSLIPNVLFNLLNIMNILNIYRNVKCALLLYWLLWIWSIYKELYKSSIGLPVFSSN